MKSPTRKKVLCVEDEESQLAMRKMLFESAGFEFLGAKTGAEALELFRSNQVDAVVLDYWMSGMKGIELAQEMKRARPAIPMVMVSGFAALPGETMGLVSAWFQKGCLEPEELVNEVRRLIDSQDAKSRKD